MLLTLQTQTADLRRLGMLTDWEFVQHQDVMVLDISQESLALIIGMITNKVYSDHWSYNYATFVSSGLVSDSDVKMRFLNERKIFESCEILASFVSTLMHGY